MKKISSQVKIEIPQDRLYRQRMAAEALLRDAAGFELVAMYRGLTKTTIIVQQRAQ